MTMEYYSTKWLMSIARFQNGHTLDEQQTSTKLYGIFRKCIKVLEFDTNKHSCWSLITIEQILVSLHVRVFISLAL